jgi:hypothetical protein
MSRVQGGRDPELPWRDREWRVAHRFIRKIQYVPETGCVLWEGAQDCKGYGHLRWRGAVRPAHVVAYEWFLGVPIPRGLQAHHITTCGHKNCVAIAHLQLVTAAQHAALHRATHCKRGHPFSPQNTYLYVRGSWVCRHCRLCARVRSQRYSAAKTAG